MSDKIPNGTGRLSHAITTGVRKTLKNPITYAGAAVVGGVSLMTKDYSWGILMPFLIPFLVQAAIRVLAEYEYQAMLDGNSKLPATENSKMAYISDISSFSTIFHAMQDSGGAHLLVKIQINPASEVIRLNETNGLSAENIMIRRIEAIIQKNFEDGKIFKVSFNAFMVILTGDYETHEERLHSFIDDNSPHQFEINDSIYCPRLLMGITPLGQHPGESFSRLEFAIQKAFLSAGRAYWYVAVDSRKFRKYRQNRIGLRKVRQALDNGELGLFAQPLVPLGHAPRNSRYEILLRHYKTAEDIRSPADILQYANFNKISQDVDLYVIKLLCENFHRLDKVSKSAIDSISVNLTDSSFTSPRFAGMITALVSRYNVPPHKLVLEITETIANQNITQAIKTMSDLKAAGFKLALDDIGIGSSNFHNLIRFPVDYYKIDRLYCEEIVHNTETRRFIQLIIDMGKARGKEIIAEGIPDQETIEMLTEMGIDFSQSALTGIAKEFITAPKFTPPS